MMGLDNPIHLAFLGIVLLLVFGAKRLPEMGHSLGTGLRGFKEAIGGEATHTPLSASEPTHAPTPVPVQVPAVQTPAPVAVHTSSVQTPAPVAIHTPSTQTPVVPLASVQDDRVA